MENGFELIVPNMIKEDIYYRLKQMKLVDSLPLLYLHMLTGEGSCCLGHQACGGLQMCESDL